MKRILRILSNTFHKSNHIRLNPEQNNQEGTRIMKPNSNTAAQELEVRNAKKIKIDPMKEKKISAKWDPLEVKIKKLLQERKYDQAMVIIKQGLAALKSILGPDHLVVCDALDYLALCNMHQGKYTEAETHYKNVIEISVRIVGENHPAVMLTFLNLAQLYAHQGRCSEAEPLYRRFQAFMETFTPPDDPKLITYILNLALLNTVLEQYAEAEQFYKRLMTIMQKAYGPNCPQLVNPLMALALQYEIQGKQSIADVLYEQASVICQQSNVNHKDLPAYCFNLAKLFDRSGKHDAARICQQRAASFTN